MISVTEEVFLQLVRLGIGTYTKASLPENVNWEEVIALAERQGLLAIMVDGIEHLPNNQRPPQEVLLQLIGTVLQGFEYRYDAYKKAITGLAAFYNSHGFKMMVLKGFACSIEWPRPEHRPCGDIDIWQFGRQDEADKVLNKEKDIKIDNSHHTHTVFEWDDFVVENHYDFLNIHARQSSAELNKIFKDLGVDDSNFVELYGEKVYVPSPNLHALFLLRHASSHFAAEGINLRQVMDWAFFVKQHTNEIDWNWLGTLIDKYHMRDFYNCVNGICVEELGFPVDIFPVVQFVPEMKEKVLNDILSPEYGLEFPKYLIPRVIYKYHRWKANSWKRELCYVESPWSVFWSSMWSHLLRPWRI